MTTIILACLAAGGWVWALYFALAAVLRYAENLQLRRRDALHERVEQLQEARHEWESRIIAAQAGNIKSLAETNAHLSHWIKQHGPADDSSGGARWKRESRN